VADLGFKEYTINFLLIGLFIIGIVSFGISLGNDYGVNNEDTGGLNYTALNNSLSSAQSDADAWQKTFTSDNPVISIGGMVLVGIWLIIKSMFVIPYQIFSILIVGVVSVLGIPPVVVGIITAILIISLIYSSYRIVKLGW
jgi:hypothetical protein